MKNINSMNSGVGPGPEFRSERLGIYRRGLKVFSTLTRGELTAVILLTVVSVVYSFVCYLSFNFLLLGDTISSVISSAIIALLFSITITVAIFLKKTSRPSRIRIISEGLLLVFFVILAYNTLPIFSHSIVVYENKSEIQQNLLSNITQAESMFSDYENYSNNRLNIYKSTLESIVGAYEKGVNIKEYKDYGFVNGVDDTTQIENKIFELKTQLYPSNYSEMERADSTWLADSKSKIKNWNPIEIVKIMNKAKVEISSWREKLKAFSKFRATSENTKDFDYVLNFDNASYKITKKRSPTMVTVIISIVIYILILLPYIAIHRHSKYPGLRAILFRSRNKSGNKSGGKIVFD